MRSHSGNSISFAVGITVAVVFLYLALRDTAPAEIAAGLAQSKIAFIPLVGGALMLQFWFKAMRWELLLRPFARTTTGKVFPATVVGYLANLVFPLYLGEIVRVYILARQLELRYSSVLATAVLERFFDFLSVLFFVGVVLIVDPQVPPALQMVGNVAGGVSVVLLVLLAVFLRWTKPLIQLTIHCTAFLPASVRQQIAEQIELAAAGLQSIRSVQLLPAIAASSLLQWGSMGVCIYLGMLGTGIDVPLSAGFVVLALTVMGVTLPSSPGFFGTIQLCFTLGLAPYGIDVSRAFAASLFFHLTIYATGWGSGLYFLRRAGLSIASLRRASIET